MADAPSPVRLITTRRGAAVAFGVTAFVFALAIRDELHPATYGSPTWTLLGGVAHGWLAVTVDVVVYSCFCWLAFSFIHDSKGRERVLIAGWCGFLLSPVKLLRPEWIVTVRDIEFLGITISFVAPLSLLLFPEATSSGAARNSPQL